MCNPMESCILAIFAQPPTNVKSAWDGDLTPRHISDAKGDSVGVRYTSPWRQAGCHKHVRIESNWPLIDIISQGL